MSGLQMPRGERKKQVPLDKLGAGSRLRIAIDEANRNAALGMTECLMKPIAMSFSG